MQPVKHKDQYHSACVTPAFRHQRQTCAGYLKLDTPFERQPPAKYFKPAIRKDALPHAGFLEPAFRKQSFDVDDYPARRVFLCILLSLFDFEVYSSFLFHVLIILFAELVSITAQAIKGLFTLQVA